MGSKLAIGAGLLAGILAGGLAIGAAVALLPPLPDPVLATPAPAPSAAGPSPVATASPATPSVSAPAPSASGVPSAAPSAPAGTGFGIGQPSPGLKIAKLGGGTIDLAALRGRPVWVNFMATPCPSCRDELSVTSGFTARYAQNPQTILSGVTVTP